MDSTHVEACPGWDRLPQACLYNILRLSEPQEIARVGSLNRICRTVSCDDRLWYNHFKKGWGPENCVSLSSFVCWPPWIVLQPSRTFCM